MCEIKRTLFRMNKKESLKYFSFVHSCNIWLDLSKKSILVVVKGSKHTTDIPPQSVVLMPEPSHEYGIGSASYYECFTHGRTQVSIKLKT